MANPTGIVNGTAAILQINTGGGFIDICGEVTHSTTYNTESIDTTNKCSDQTRTLLAGEGTQSIDISVESLFSDDAAFQFLRSKYFDKASFPAQQIIGSNTLSVTVMVTNMADTAGLNETVKTSFTLNSTGTFSEA